MAKQSLINLKFPLGGLNRRYGYRQQPPYTTADCLNVRPRDTMEHRDRGGSRPGLVKAFYEQLGTGSPVRMLGEVTAVQTDGFAFWADDFSVDTLSSVWSAASWATAAPAIFPDDEAAVAYATGEVGAVRTALSDLKVASAYQIELFIAPRAGAYGGDFKIYARMASTTPVATTNGVVATLSLTGATGAYSGRLEVYVAGVKTTYPFTAGTLSAPTAGRFKLLINGNAVSAFWQGATLLSAQTVSAPTGPRFGFGMEATEPGSVCLVSEFRIQYYRALAETRRNIVLASAGGKLYKEGLLGQWVEVTGGPSLASDHLIQSAECGGKLYIADYGEPLAQGTDGVIASNDVDLTSATLGSTWDVLGIDTATHVVVVSNVTGNAVAGTYRISAVVAAKLTTTAAVGDGTCAFRVERAPKVYDPTANTLAVWTATDGQVPCGCPCIARYSGRIVLCGGGVWYMSRQEDPFDFDYGATADDLQRAVAGSSAEAGQIAGEITSIIAHSDDLLLWGCIDSMWVLRGDPLAGGRNQKVTDMVGAVDKAAICRGPEGETYFQTLSGLFLLAPGAGAFPKNLSGAALPAELLRVDRTLYDVALAYAIGDNALHIFITPKAGHAGRHWWFDLKTGTFWPDRYPAVQQPTAALSYFSHQAAESRTLLGGIDGYVRIFRDEAASDDGTETESWVTYGPLPLARQDLTEGNLLALDAVLDRESGSVTWSVAVASSHEGALRATAQKTGTLTAGVNYTARPRASGSSLALTIENAVAHRAWALEELVLTVEEAGPRRP